MKPIMNKYRVYLLEERGFTVDIETNNEEEAQELTQDISSEDVPKWNWCETRITEIEEL